jgi:uncharacterized protein (TIGR02145 family)
MKNALLLLFSLLTILCLSQCDKLTGKNEAPSMPSNPDPGDKTVDQALDPFLTCAVSIDPDDDPVTYDVYFDSTTEPVIVRKDNYRPEYKTPILKINKTYYWRVVAKDNQNHETAGPLWSFTTSSLSAECKDYDGNVYKTVVIGAQLWMAENLKTTHYGNGDPIPNVTDNSLWSSLSGAYCNYNNDTNIGSTYGRLYNFSVIVDSRNLCPNGWHVPSDDEWYKLIRFLDPSVHRDSIGYYTSDIAGGKMKAKGTIENGDGLWYSPNTEATNESRFNAIPGGLRDYSSGEFYYFGYECFFWTSTEVGNIGAACINLLDLSPGIDRFNFFSQYGFSLRCVKD